MSPSFLIQATNEVASSGNDVPKANSVSPMTASLTPKDFANPMPPFSKKEAPRTNRINPDSNNNTKGNVFECRLSSTETSAKDRSSPTDSLLLFAPLKLDRI